MVGKIDRKEFFMKNNTDISNNKDSNKVFSKVFISCDVGINENYLESTEKSTFLQERLLHF